MTNHETIPSESFVYVFLFKFYRRTSNTRHPIESPRISSFLTLQSSSTEHHMSSPNSFLLLTFRQITHNLYIWNNLKQQELFSESFLNENLIKTYSLLFTTKSIMTLKFLVVRRIKFHSDSTR